MGGKALPFIKKLLYYGLLAALMALAFEGMARAAYWLAFEEGYDGGSWGERAAGFTAEVPVWNTPAARRIRHPFYGHTPVSPVHSLNALPLRGSPYEPVVIGLVGGSVAYDLLPYFSRAVHRYFSDNGLSRRPAVLGLGYLSMKQPQPVMATANRLLLGGRFDIIVNLDGYNEIFFSSRNYREGIFPFYPYQWSALDGLTAEETLLAGRIGVLREEQEELRRAAAHPLRHTAVFGLVNRYGWEIREEQALQLNRDLTAGRSDYIPGRHGPRSRLRTEGELYPEVGRVWYRSSLALAELAELAGAEYYHFLQPNQYVPGAKPLTAAELACCYTGGGSREQIYRSVYPDMARLGERLRRRSVNYFDLTPIFKDNRETLYGDDCCHLNERGNELLAAALVERLGPALEQAAARPVSGWGGGARPTPESVPEELLVDDYFRVYLRGGNRLVYVREVCTLADIKGSFFLHIAPADLADLPAKRRGYGFENWDFQFERDGGIFNGECRAERQLPYYDIAAIRTGQYIYGGDTLWEGEYRFEE